MYKIIDKQILAPQVYLMEIEAPRIANAALPGQFVVVINDRYGERVPLTIYDYDSQKGTVSIVFQAIGASTNQLAGFKIGDSLFGFAGPLGRPSDLIHTDISELKNTEILFIGGGVGIAPVYPQAKWLHQRGIDVDLMIGARNREMVILEERLRSVSKNLYIATDDGSYGFHGLVTDYLKHLIDNEGKHFDKVIAIGPMIMMKFVSLLTKKYGIKTIVSLNPLMVDATGMCGACRVLIGGETKFACVDGPEFDGHLVDFDNAISRLTMYKTEEQQKMHSSNWSK